MWLTLIGATGCSWVFQDKLKGGYKQYSGNEAPVCSKSNGWAIADGVFAALNVAGAIVAGNDQTLSDDDKKSFIAGGLLWGVIHFASAASGASASTDCRKAFAKWNERDYDNNNENRRRDDLERDDNERDETRTRRQEHARDELEAKRDEPTPEAPAHTPRGFFCSGSIAQSTVGLCIREKLDCKKARDTIAGAVGDLSACTLAELAWCFDDGKRCAPSRETCVAQRTAAIANWETPTMIGDCLETN